MPTMALQWAWVGWLCSPTKQEHQGAGQEFKSSGTGKGES